MAQKQITLILTILLLNIYNRTWKDLPKYYKCLFYTSFINSLYYYLFKRHLLWEFRPGRLNWRALRKVHIFLISPLLVLLFLSTLPKSFTKQVIHLIKWVVSSSMIEYFLAKKQLIIFKYGWNVFWSGLVYVQMYVFSYLFLKRPLLIWILSLFTTIFYMVQFKMPLTIRLLKGPYFLLFKKTRCRLKEHMNALLYPYFIYFRSKLITFN
jgi:hypothetical protein